MNQSSTPTTTQLPRKTTLLSRFRYGRLEGLFQWVGAYKEAKRNRALSHNAVAAHRYALKCVQGKKPIRVVFLLIHESVWKYDTLYRMLENDPAYNPVIVVCPYILYGETILQEEMRRTYTHFSHRYQNVVSAWDATANTWIDVKETLKPDLVFFTNPHELTLPEYYIHHFSDTLTAYVQYSFHITHLNKLQYNQPFHNLLWVLFYETPFHGKLAATHATNRGRNVVITGYPGTDVFLDPAYKPSNPWKQATPGAKRLIWAPHHTIFDNDSDLSYSTFLTFADYFLKLATEAVDSSTNHSLVNDYFQKFASENEDVNRLNHASFPVQLAFKPHPVLKAKLHNHPDWGKEKTDAYYEAWQTAAHGQLEEGDYIDLFLTSDALLFDSASFMTEYLYTDKPSLFLVNDDRLTERFNDFGNRVFDLLYHAHTQFEVEAFLKTVVFEGLDSLKGIRKTFKKNTLIPPNNRSASENIYDYLNQQLMGNH